MADAAPGAEHPKPAPRTTLQMLILYPTLLLSLGGSIPTLLTWVEAWRKDVRVSELALAKEADSLWRRNLDCLVQASSWEVDGPRQLVIKVTICKNTGDALLRYFANDWSPKYRWVRSPDSDKKP